MKNKAEKSLLNKFRTIGIAEGISFLVLLGIAMPLKYMAGFPMAVKVVGWMHGLLFILYVVNLAQVKTSYNWSIKKSLIAFIAALLPFGTFVLDNKLKQEEAGLIESN